MDIYALLKEENQRFWDFLDLDNIDRNVAEASHEAETIIVEEISEEMPLV